jgi:cation diffusion facilitator family transporter
MALNPKVSAARVSVISNTSLTLIKLAAGLMTGSVSVLSEAVHSANDLVAAAIAYFSVRMSDRPADVRHPYGHGKVESMSGLIEALLIFGAAAYIVYEAVKRLLAGSVELMVGPGLVVMLISGVTNVLISRYLFHVAKAEDSLALLADAEHLRTDVITSFGVVAGLALVWLTGRTELDAIVALIVAAVICRAAYRLTREALEPLLDARLPDADLRVVRGVLDNEPAVLAYHKLRSRKSGSSRHVDAHVLVDDHLSLIEAHELTERLEDRIRELLPRAEVMLHTEPHNAEVAHQLEYHADNKPQ